MVYLGERIESLEEIKNLPITYNGSELILLKDLAREDGIQYVDASLERYSKINGKQGIQISFQKQSDIGITDATENIYNKLDELLEDYPEASYLVLLDQGDYINQSINTVLQNIIIGGVLAIFILFLFLRDTKPTIIVGLAIPISVIGTFMLMFFTNVTLNIVSMGGLALAIGMLVDNAVVVIENIYRMINEGKSRYEAAIEGAKQVAGAITASTLTTVAVFLPIVFVEGLISEVFISMALTIAYSLGASLVIALTLVPAMSSRFLEDKSPKSEGKIIIKLKKWYESAIRFTLKFKKIVILGVLALLVSSFYIVIEKGFILFPSSDEGTINISIETKGSATFLGRAELADYLTEELLKYDDVETVSGRIGGGSGFMSMMQNIQRSGETISLTVNLKENRKLSTAENRLMFLDLLENLEYNNLINIISEEVLEYEVVAQNSTLTLAGSTGVNIKVSGYDLLTLEQIANDLVEIIEGVENVVDIDNGILQGQDQIKITVNKNNAMTLGLTNQDVLNNLNYLYSNLGSLSQSQSITVKIEGVDYEIDIPNESFGSISFNMFGDFQTFLSGVMLFDKETQTMIDIYNQNPNLSLFNLNTVYILNAALPTYQMGDPIVFIVNPFLRINVDNEIVFDPLNNALPTLASLVKAPLFELNDEINSIADVEKVTGFALINTDGTQRYLSVTAQIEEGYNVTLVSQNVIEAVNEYLEGDFKEYGSGYSISFEGENEEIMNAIQDLALAALVAILLVYMIIAIQFQSLKYPLIILVTVPLAFTGGLIALIVTNMYLSMVSLMGFILLIGVVVNNGIVLIDYINKLREQGHTVEAAIIEAGQTRLRPIFMTALTTILALVVTALGFGEGAELLQPMAVTAIGGLIYATVLTLVVAPMIYAMFNRKIMKEEGLKNADN